jgi:hypothetical protein
MSAMQQMLLAAAGGSVAAPVNTAAPVISGTAQVGSTLTTTNGTWTGSPTGYTYQWLRNGANISGATSSSYLLVIADLAATITVIVTATNTAGSDSATSTAGVGPIGSAPAVARSAMLMGSVPVVVNTSTTSRDANAAGVMINSR